MVEIQKIVCDIVIFTKTNESRIKSLIDNLIDRSCTLCRLREVQLIIIYRLMERVDFLSFVCEFVVFFY